LFQESNSGLAEVCLNPGRLLKNFLCHIIVSKAKDLPGSFSVRYIRCFAALSMTGGVFNSLLVQSLPLPPSLDHSSRIESRKGSSSPRGDSGNWFSTHPQGITAKAWAT
jgi:hypothetical protein